MVKIIIDAHRILQINATIIAGILILMTVGSFNQPNPHLSGAVLKTINQWVSLTLIPFVVSSFCVIMMTFDPSDKVFKGLEWSSRAGMLGGVIYLGFLVIIIATS